MSISRDLRHIRLRLPLNWRTTNPVGTLFGGSLYAATDPMYPTLLSLALGRDVVIWDKAGHIRYRKPGRSTLYADFSLDDAELADLRASLAREGHCERCYRIELKDAQGVVHTEIEKTVYLARKDVHRQRVSQNEEMVP